MAFLTSIKPALRCQRLYSTSGGSSADYCLELVKKYDYENFLSTILMQRSARTCALAIRSFNIEVSRIFEQVTQDHTGLMRIKFWEDTLEKCYANDIKKIPQHPVASELYKCIQNARLTKRYFNNLISCRKDCLHLNIFNTLEDMEKYADSSVSSNYYLILEACQVRNVHADHAASHLGKAQGLTQFLRSFPHISRLKFIPVPQNLLSKNHVSQEDIFRGQKLPEISDCVYEIASRAHQHLQKSKSLLEQVPTEGRQALLPSIPVGIYLDLLQKSNYNVFDESLNRRNWYLLPKLLTSRFQNKY